MHKAFLPWFCPSSLLRDAEIIGCPLRRTYVAPLDDLHMSSIVMGEESEGGKWLVRVTRMPRLVLNQWKKDVFNYYEFALSFVEYFQNLSLLGIQMFGF